QRAQAPGGSATHLAPGPSEYKGGQAGGPHQKTVGSATRRVVHPSVPVRPTAPEQNRTQDPVARQPWVAPVTRVPGRHDQVYALFDRRCRTQTALDKLAALRRRVQRFKALGDTLKKLFSPTLEKALTFLDDKLTPCGRTFSSATCLTFL